MQHGGRACFPPESTALLDLSGKPSTVSSVPFLDPEHACSLQDFAHSRSSLDRESVDLGSKPSLLRVTLGKVNSEDLSLHLEGRDNYHCLTPHNEESTLLLELGIYFLPSLSPSCSSAVELPSCISKSFSWGYPWRSEENLEEQLYPPHLFSVLSSPPSCTSPYISYLRIHILDLDSQDLLKVVLWRLSDGWTLPGIPKLLL